MAKEIRNIITDQIRRHVAMSEAHRAWLADDIATRVEAEVATVFKRVPSTADGHPIFIGDEVWFYEEDSRAPMSEKVTAIYGKSPVHGHVYPGDFVIGADWFEGGSAEVYHSKDKVPTPAV